MIAYFGVLTMLLYLSGLNESGANKNDENEKAFVKTKEYVWRQKKVMWEEQLFLLE